MTAAFYRKLSLVKYCKTRVYCRPERHQATIDGSVANYSNRPRNYTAPSVNRLVHERTDAAWSGPGIRKRRDGRDESAPAWRLQQQQVPAGDDRRRPGQARPGHTRRRLSSAKRSTTVNPIFHYTSVSQSEACGPLGNTRQSLGEVGGGAQANKVT